MHRDRGIRPALEEDIHRVVSGLSDLTWQELRAFFPGEPDTVVLDEIMENCTDALGRGMLDAVCLREDAIALVGLRWQQGECFTSFFGTDRYFRRDMLPISISYCRLLRQRLDEDVIALSRSGHPEVERWFRLIGFEPDGCEHGARVFRMRESLPMPRQCPPAGAVRHPSSSRILAP